MDVEIRPAEHDDIPDLAELYIIAADGWADAVYGGLVPGLPTNEIVERRFHRDDATTSYRHCWVAMTSGKVAGKLHAFPFDDLMENPADPLIPAERYVLFQTFDGLEAPGSYYVNVIAVFPQFQGEGIGRRLLSLAHSQAREKGCAELNLHVFEQNEGAVGFYRRLGFTVKARNPVVEHQLIRYSGDMLLMTCPA